MATGLEFKVFRGVGAVIAKVTSHSKFSVLPIVDQERVVDFSATERLIDVDLDATPKTVGASDPASQAVARWSEVKFDDRGVDKLDRELRTAVNAATLPLGITTLGSPRLLHNERDLTLGAFVGAVYIEAGLFRQIEKSALTIPGAAPWPGTFFALHEITSIAYSKNEANGPRHGRRYHGFTARVVNVIDGGAAIEVEVPAPRDGQPAPRPIVVRLDDEAQCDRDPPAEALGGAPSLASAPMIGAQGALFLALPFAVSNALSGPKLPIGQGD